MKRKVFISHSSVDKPFVRKLKTDLNQNYIDTWVDEDEMNPGDILQERLDYGLDKSTHIIIVLSPNSVNSEWVKYELTYALKMIEESAIEKIIPILYRECKIPSELEKIIRLDVSRETVYFRHQYLEFYGNTYYDELHKLVKSIFQKGTMLTPQEKDDIIDRSGTLLGQGGFDITILFKIVGFKSISKYLNTYADKTYISSLKQDGINNLNPIVLPIKLKGYLNELKFGDKISIQSEKATREIKLDFVNYSNNNSRIAISLQARKALKVEINESYVFKISNDGKTIKILEAKDN